MELNILTFNELDPSEASLKATRSEVPCEACRRRKEGVLSETVGIAMFGTMEVVVVVVEMGSTCSARANSAALDGAVRRSFLWSGELVLLFMMSIYMSINFFSGASLFASLQKAKFTKAQVKSRRHTRELESTVPPDGQPLHDRRPFIQVEKEARTGTSRCKQVPFLSNQPRRTA